MWIGTVGLSELVLGLVLQKMDHLTKQIKEINYQGFNKNLESEQIPASEVFREKMLPLHIHGQFSIDSIRIRSRFELSFSFFWRFNQFIVAIIIFRR